MHQRGSLVNEERLRFDFSHDSAVSPAEIRQIEQIANTEILKNTEVTTEVMDMEQAKAMGAMALFGEKYGDRVRVVSIGGQFSIELCGGTHVTRTGDIGLIKVSAETSVASGIRRIESVTGMQALAFCDEQQDSIGEIVSIVRGSRSGLAEKVNSLVDENRRLQKDIERLKDKLAGASGKDMMSGVQEINGVSVLATLVEGADGKSLRGIGDQIRSKMESGMFVLGAIEGSKASLLAGVTQNLTDQIKAGDLLKHVTDQTGGKGGGRPDLAQGATNGIADVPAALESIYDWAKESLS